METIVIMPKNKKAIPFLKHLLTNLNDVASVEVVEQSTNYVAKSIDSGLKEAKAIVAGKKKGRSLKQLLDED